MCILTSNGVNLNHHMASFLLSRIYALTQNIYIHCNTSPPNDCLSVCRHHCIGGCTSVRPVLGTLYVVYPEYLLVLCQRSPNLLPCKLTGCRVRVGWGHGTCDRQWLTFDHLLQSQWLQLRFIYVTIEKGRDLTRSYDKSPYTNRKFQKASWQHKNATKTFDYTTTADRLRTVSWSTDSNPTGVVKTVYGIKPSHLPQKLCNQKETHLKINGCLWNTTVCPRRQQSRKSYF